MPDRRKTFIVLAVVVAVLLVLAYRDNPAARQSAEPEIATVVDDAGQNSSVARDEDVADGLPRLVEVGADSCVPCKMMQPILDELRSDYAGELTIEFADIWKNPDLGDKYGVRSIPTQIIYDAEGDELLRHTGFWAKEDIDAKLKELGILAADAQTDSSGAE